MPAAPTLSTSIISGAGGHIANTNTVHGVIDAIYLATIGGTHTTAFTLVQADSGELIPVNSASAVQVTVPVLAVGTSVEILRQGAGAVTLTASGTTLTGPAGATLTPRVQGSFISLLWLTTTDVRVGGDLT